MKALIFSILFCFASLRPVQAGDTIIDMAGRTVEVHGPANRIVTTFKPASLLLLCLDLADKWVGVDTQSKRDRLQQAVFPAVTSLAGVGSKTTGINLETIVTLKPDLVILYAQYDGLEKADRLADLNIPAVIILPETFDTIRTSLSVVARATGKTDRLETVCRLMDGVLSLLDQRLGDLGPKQRKTGYFASPRGIFNTATGNMLQSQILARAGIDNVAAGLTGYFQDISAEQLIRWDPEVVVLSQHLPRSEAGRLSKTIAAVRTGHVFFCPSNLAPWDFPSPMSVLASLWLAHRTFPDRFSDLSLEDQVNRFHQALFNQRFSSMGGRLDGGMP